MSNEPMYLGIDNGVSGSLVVLGGLGEFEFFSPIPTKIDPGYGKVKKKGRRIDSPQLYSLLFPFKRNMSATIERPMVNPGRFKATASALRAYEATVITLEQLNIPFRTIDSRVWQHKFLSHIPEKKIAASGWKIVGLQGLADYPRIPTDCIERMTEHGDADAFYLALYELSCKETLDF